MTMPAPEQLLLLALAIPLAGAALIALCGRWPNLRETATLATAGALFATVIQLFRTATPGDDPRLELVELLPGLSLTLYTEPLSLLFALIASGLWLVTSVYAIGYMRGNHEKRQTPFYVCFAVSIFGAMGVAFAANLLTLFVFYEVLTLSTYPLVAHKGNGEARAGARTYLGILLATSIGLFLPALLWTYAVAGTLDFTPGGILAGHLPGWAAALLLALFVYGTGKAAVMPVHRWLPAAMVAPTPVSALLHAVAVVKAGVFTVSKVVVYIFGSAFMLETVRADGLVIMAAFTILAASIIALRQSSLKKMLAYSTVSQLSYVVLAALVLAPLGLPGVALHIAAHAVAKITLFFAAGAIYVASKKTELDQLDGIGWRMPVTMAAFTIAALSMIGIPPTAGFVSKWYLVSGALQAEHWLMLGVLMLSSALNAAYFLPVVFRAFFRRETVAPAKPHREAPLPMVLALAFTALLTLLFLGLADGVLGLDKAMVGY